MCALYANFVHSLLSLFFLLTIDCSSVKKVVARCDALVSECAPIAIVIAPRATVVISDNSSDPAQDRPRRNRSRAASYLLPAKLAHRTDRAVSRASDNIRAASVMRERSSASVILRGSTRTCS